MEVATGGVRPLRGDAAALLSCSWRGVILDVVSGCLRFCKPRDRNQTDVVESGCSPRGARHVAKAFRPCKLCDQGKCMKGSKGVRPKKVYAGEA